MIPDAVSTSSLAGLLGQVHLSDRIPAVRCGGDTGGPVDLAFLFDQVIRRSINLNAVQITCAISFVLGDLLRYFELQVAAIQERTPPYDSLLGDISEAAIAGAAQQILADRDTLLAAQKLVDGVMHRMLDQYAPIRVGAIDMTVDDNTTEEQFRSAFALSDELLEDLGIDRAQVDSFLAN